MLGPDTVLLNDSIPAPAFVSALTPHTGELLHAGERPRVRRVRIARA
jgi:hypothetical protein